MSELARLKLLADSAVGNAAVAELLWQLLERIQTEAQDYLMVWHDDYHGDPSRVKLRVVWGEEAVDLAWPVVVATQPDEARRRRLIVTALQHLVDVVWPSGNETSAEAVITGLQWLLPRLQPLSWWQISTRELRELIIDDPLRRCLLDLLCCFEEELTQLTVNYDRVDCRWVRGGEAIPLATCYREATAAYEQIDGFNLERLQEWRRQVSLLAIKRRIAEAIRRQQLDEGLSKRIRDAIRATRVSHDDVEPFVWHYVQEVVGAVWQQVPAVDEALQVPEHLNSLDLLGAAVPQWHNDPTFLVARARRDWYHQHLVEMLVRGDLPQAVDLLARSGKNLRLTINMLYPYQGAFHYMGADTEIAALAFKYCWENRLYGRAAAIAGTFGRCAVSYIVANHEMEQMLGEAAWQELTELQRGEQTQIQLKIWEERLQQVRQLAAEHNQHVTIFQDPYLLR